MIADWNAFMYINPVATRKAIVSRC